MDAAAYLRGVLRSWWLVGIVVAAGAVGGFGVYKTTTPLYESSVTMIVAPKTAGADALTARTLSELRAGTLSQVAPTNPAIDAAAQAAGLDGRPQGLTVNASTSGAFVTIAIRCEDPDAAFALASTYPTMIDAQASDLAGTATNEFKLTIVDQPALPTDPVEPSLSRNLGLGLAAGLVLGLALAILRETLTRVVRETDELVRLSGLPLLGVVPDELPKDPLPAGSHPRSARAEAYRQIRTTVLSASERRPLVVAVTSATMGEGKTSVATNLAVVLSRAGHRVALVDADLRRPKVAEFMSISGERGLTDVLSGDLAIEDALVLRDEGRLGVLPAGGVPANPSEALGSTRMQSLLGDLSDRFEFVVVDTPPVIPVTDALVLAPLVNGLVLVARLGETTPDRLARTQAAIERVHAAVFGVVANHAGKGSDSDYSYTYKPGRDGEPTAEVPVETDANPSAQPGRHQDRPTIPVTTWHGPSDDHPAG